MSGVFALLAVAAISGSPAAPLVKIECAAPNPLLAEESCLSDAELAALRGGFALPNGLDVSIAVQTVTSLDGALLLRSVYRIDMGQPMWQVFAPQPGQIVPVAASATGTSNTVAGQPNLSISFDRFNGVSFVPSSSSAIPTSVNVTTDGTAPAPAATDSLAPLDLSNGPVQTAGGVVTLIALPGGQQVHLAGDMLDVNHIVGQAIGALIANSGNDRMIDTTTTVALDVRGATAANLGSAMLRIDEIAGEAVRSALSH